MAATQEGKIGGLIRKVEERAEAGEAISIGLIREIAGRRAAWPMLLLPALIVVSPLSIIPGLPSMVGLNTILVASQIVLGRDQFWLPKWLVEREVPGKRVKPLLKFLGKAGGVVDTVVKPRAKFLTTMPMRRVGAALCVLVGAIMPLLEFIPFTSTWAGAIIAVYALAITVRDGFLALAFVGLVSAVAGAGFYFFM